MKRIKEFTIDCLFLLLIFIIFSACGSQNQNENNPIIPDPPAKNLSYKVKLNGSSKVSIQYLTPASELIEIIIGLAGGMQVFHFDFTTPGDVHFISARVPDNDSTHTYLLVTAGGFTKSGKNFVEVSF